MDRTSLFQNFFQWLMLTLNAISINTKSLVIPDMLIDMPPHVTCDGGPEQAPTCFRSPLKLHSLPLLRPIQFLFTWWRAPQQMLRTHHSLKAFYATIWWWRWAVFYKVLHVMEHQWNEIDRGKPTTRRKTCPSATLSTTYPTWTWPGIEPGPPQWEAGD
jgi:hypothetical protein